MALNYTPTNKAAIEQARIAAIDNFARTGAVQGYESLIAEARADGRSTPQDIALAIVADIQRTHAAAAAASPNHTGAGPAASTRLHGGRQGQAFPDLEAVERAADSEWATAPAVRAEFRGNKAAFVALRKAEARGQASRGSHYMVPSR